MATPTAYHRHDHRQCVADALSTARQLCRQRGAKLTRIREQVLTEVWDSHQPLGAYAILERLAERGECHPAPPTVYRALDFLQELGLVHRIASLNAFIGCDDPSHPHQGHFLICRHCHTTVEVNTAPLHEAIAQCATQHGFAVEAECVEVVGCCPNCQQREAGDEH